MSALPSVYLEGMAFWAARMPGWEAARAVIRGEHPPADAPAARPAPALLAPTERRRAPDTVAVALEVAARACQAAGRSPSELPSVFASTHGDLAISDYMCSTLASTPALISPTKFHNSVHNAAAGYWSMGTRSHAPYTALSAYRYTFGTGLLEAATQVVCEARAVLYVAFDIEARGPLATVAPSRGLLGVAMVLSPVQRATPAPQLDIEVHPSDRARPTPARSAAAALIQENALAPCMPFLEALAGDTGGSVVLALSERLELKVTLT